MSKTLKGGNPGGRIKQSNVRKMERGGRGARLPHQPGPGMHAESAYFAPQCTYGSAAYYFVGQCETISDCIPLCAEHCGGTACTSQNSMQCRTNYYGSPCQCLCLPDEHQGYGS